jgi:hypothetical protein
VLTGKKMKREEHHFQDKVGGIFYLLFLVLSITSSFFSAKYYGFMVGTRD